MKAMVLCAGFGTRLGDLTRELPKPMLPVGGHPLVEYTICNLIAHGFDEIAINLHFMPEAITGYCGDGSRWKGRLSYSFEPELLGTAGGVKKMAGFLGSGGPFLIHYGDVLTNQDFTAMLRFHQQRRALATLLVHERMGSVSAVTLNVEGRVDHFLERPSAAERQGVTSAWTFSGVAICEPAFLDEIPGTPQSDLPRDLFTKLASGGRLFAFPLTGQRWAIDSPARLAEAAAAVQLGQFRMPCYPEGVSQHSPGSPRSGAPWVTGE